jgi:hypothetical protein
MMIYLDHTRLAAIDAAAFRAQKPYPWVNPSGLLTETGYRRLLQTLPDVSLFTPFFGVRRAHGQQSHDRFVLEYRNDLAVAAPWREFIAELRGREYRAFLLRLLGVRAVTLSFHWHYTPAGCSVSPHCDAKHKLGSHIFYFNTPEDWEPAWGGETLILDDEGRFDRRSAPRFEDFSRIFAAETLGNRSLLFARTAHSWHGVRELRCPPGALRKVFIVVINRDTPLDRLRRLLGGAARGYAG